MDERSSNEDGQPGPEAREHSPWRPDLGPAAREYTRGRLPGSRYVRIVRPFTSEFRRTAPGHLVARERVLQPRGPVGRALEWLRRILIGARLPSALEMQERVGRIKGLAIFASDNISSSAYATEEIMRVLILAGIGALALALPVTLAIIAVLAIVVISYLQVIRAYPAGGGSYVVAHENIGSLAGLTAAAALLTDYILTVAVSISAGTAAITSALPELFDVRVPISVSVIVAMTILNLRGVRESGSVFAAPTYVYVAVVVGMLGFGLYRHLTGTLPQYEAPEEWIHGHGTEPLALLLVLRAFASGSVALTGTEAVADGIQAFKPPEVRHAQQVLIAMGALFATLFLGMSVLASQIGIVPDPAEAETVLSQIARTVLGGAGPFYYVIQAATAIILLLAANTAFNGFPRLASILAQDRYLPRQFLFRGDRLAFTIGILFLPAVAIPLVIYYQSSVAALIPLYTVGVFIAFTLSQAGLALRWWRLRRDEPSWRRRAAVNALGTLATGVVAMVVGATKFLLGAWMVLVLMPVLIAMMWAIRRHYRYVEDALALEPPDTPLPPREPPHVVVPVSRLDRSLLQALAFARSISPDVTAVHITDNPGAAEDMRQRWERWGVDVPMVIVESPYRALIPPLLAYIDAIDRQDPKRPITVVIPEFVPRHFWEWILHNQTALRLKLQLFFRPNTIVIDVPYYLGRSGEEEQARARSTRARR